MYLRNILEAQQAKLGDQAHVAKRVKCEAKIWSQAAGWMLTPLMKIEKTGKEAGLGLVNNFYFSCVNI